MSHLLFTLLKLDEFTISSDWNYRHLNKMIHELIIVKNIRNDMDAVILSLYAVSKVSNFFKKDC